MNSVTTYNTALLCAASLPSCVYDGLTPWTPAVWLALSFYLYRCCQMTKSLQTSVSCQKCSNMSWQSRRLRSTRHWRCCTATSEWRTHSCCLPVTCTSAPGCTSFQLMSAYTPNVRLLNACVSGLSSSQTTPSDTYTVLCVAVLHLQRLSEGHCEGVGEAAH